MTLVCLTYSVSKGDWRERPGSKVDEFDLCLENRFKSHFTGQTEAKGRLSWH